MVDQKLLHKQYLIDELGNKTAIVLSMDEFQNLLDDIDDLATLADDSGQQTKSPLRAEKQLSEQHVERLKHYHSRFEKLIIKLHEYKNLKVDLKRQLLLQEIMEDIEKELQRIRHQLAQLKKDTQPATLHNVPALPSNTVINNTLFNQIKQQILVEYKEARPPILLSASVGLGKSVLAATLARDSAIRTAYPDGIFWIEMGKDPDLLSRMMYISHNLDEKKLSFVDMEAAGERIKRLTATQTCLVVFDDAIDPQDILPFNVLGQYGQMLITTSEEGFFEILKYFLPTTVHFNLEAFLPENAVNYFMQRVGTQIKRENVPIKLDSLAKLCQYSPSLLGYVAHVAKRRALDEWKDVVRELQNTDFEFPKKYPHILMQALFMNVEDLGEQGEYYSSLSVFGDYTRIPVTAIKVLWRYLYQMSNEDVENFLAELAARDMLQLHDFSSGKAVSLHSYQYEFVHAESEPDKLHNHLLVAYRRLCDQHGWISGPNDGYFFQYLGMHLYNANRKGELKTLLLDLDWIQKKLEITPFHVLLMDYDWFEGDEDIMIVREALYEGASVLLSRHKQEDLASQILNHLWDKVSDSSNKELQALVHQSKEAAPDWKWVEPFPEELMGSSK